MADTTEIAWTDSTANLWWGCVEVHAGCDFCYARTFSANRTGKSLWGTDVPRRAIKGVWGDLSRWQRTAADFFAEHGRRRTVFVGSMMDIFEKGHPALDSKGEPVEGGTAELRRRFFEEVVPATPDLIYLLLTKRPSNVLKMVPAAWLAPGGWPAHVWVGTSVVDQQTADTLIPQILRIPGPTFLSMEPLIGPVDLTAVYADVMDEAHGVHALAAGIGWIIVGGESGYQPGVRAMHPAWARAIRDACAAAGVPFLFKQWGAWLPVAMPNFTFDGPRCLLWPDGHVQRATAGDVIRVSGDGWGFEKVGKEKAGRHLDQRLHDGFPEAFGRPAEVAP